MTKPKTKSLPPIPLPKDLTEGDVLVCNHGERVKFKMYDGDGDIHTFTTSDHCNTWRPNGRNWGNQQSRWIVAIERKAKPPAKPKESPKIKLVGATTKAGDLRLPQAACCLTTTPEPHRANQP